MEIKRINLKDKTIPLTFSEIMNARIVSVKEGTVRYNRKEIINLISLLTAFKMVTNNKSEDNSNTFIKLVKNEFPIVNTIRSYIACQLEVVNEVSKDSLDDLVRSTHPVKINIHNDSKDKIVRFAYYENLENITLLRLTEFGYFCISGTAQQMFIGIPNKDILEFRKNIKPKFRESIINKIDEQIFKLPETVKESLQEESYRFLLRLFNYSYDSKKINKHLAYQFGLDTIRHINFFISNWKQLKQTVELVIDNGLGQNKHKGRRL